MTKTVNTAHGQRLKLMAEQVYLATPAERLLLKGYEGVISDQALVKHLAERPALFLSQTDGRQVLNQSVFEQHIHQTLERASDYVIPWRPNPKPERAEPMLLVSPSDTPFERMRIVADYLNQSNLVQTGVLRAMYHVPNNESLLTGLSVQDSLFEVTDPASDETPREQCHHQLDAFVTNPVLHPTRVAASDKADDLLLAEVSGDDALLDLSDLTPPDEPKL